MTVFKRPGSDVWQCKFSQDGVTVRESTGVTGPKHEAQAWETKRRQQLRDDAAAKRLGHKHTTLYALAESWLAASELTHRDHRNNVHRVRKLFGDSLVQDGTNWVLTVGNRHGLPKDLPVEALTQDHLVRLKVARLREGVAPATVNREMSLIQTLIGFAKSLSIVTPNPPLVWTAGRNKAASVKMPERKGKLRWLRVWEEHQLLTSLANEADKNCRDQTAIDAYALVMFLLDTGARYNEVAQVRWAQLDLDAGTISLYRGKVDNESMLMLPARTLTMLRDRRRAMLDVGHPSSYVFPALKGRAWEPGVDRPRGHATKAIQGHIDRCGFNNDPTSDKVTPHTFRDTFAARLVQAGVSLLKVSKLLGHATVVMTQKYAHLSPEATGAEAAAVLNALHGNKPTHGDDHIAGVSGRSSGHTSGGHSHRLMLAERAKNPQVLDTQGDFLDLMVGRAGVEPTTNGLKERQECSKPLISKEQS